jgi:hypothetical protein
VRFLLPDAIAVVFAASIAFNDTAGTMYGGAARFFGALFADLIFFSYKMSAFFVKNPSKTACPPHT